MREPDARVAELGMPCHVGIVVADLEAAKADLAATTGHCWVDTLDGEIDVLIDERRRSIRTRIAWSVQGPCHLELIEAVPDTLWPVRDTIEIHHIGYWVDDLDRTSRQLERRGMPLEVRFDSGSDERTVFVYHLGHERLRIELGGEPQRNLVRSRIAAWLAENPDQETDSG